MNRTSEIKQIARRRARFPTATADKNSARDQRQPNSHQINTGASLKRSDMRSCKHGSANHIHSHPTSRLDLP